jgi:succinate dehydrogenase/fumarate reductase flavoprotein subunit
MLEKMEIIMEETTQQDTTEEVVDESTDGIKQLREEYKKLKAENKQFKANAMSTALGSLGLEPDKGIGKAVTKLYDGDLTVEAIQEFVAQEFGEVSSSEQPSQQPDINSNVVEAQSRVEQLNKIGVNNEPTDVRQEFQKFVTDSNNSTRDVINAKLRMIDTLKEQDK